MNRRKRVVLALMTTLFLMPACLLGQDPVPSAAEVAKMQAAAPEEARVQAEATLAKARQQIERDTNQALQKIREEVADLTVAATEKVARTSLSGEDQLRLIQEAINEIDLRKVSEN